MTRPALWERPVSYAAVGATKAADLLQYPPEGYRPIERRSRVGHGEARFEYAWTTALSWGIQRNSGFTVRIAQPPSEVTDGTYSAVNFAEDGAPIRPAERREDVFGPDGTPLLVPGDTVELVIPFGPFGVAAPARVVYVIDEPNRKGFAYGTLPGHPEDGEEAFIVELNDDGSVWLTIRAFSRPANRWWWVVYPVLRAVQEVYTRRYLRSLSGPIS